MSYSAQSLSANLSFSQNEHVMLTVALICFFLILPEAELSILIQLSDDPLVQFEFVAFPDCS